MMGTMSFWCENNIFLCWCERWTFISTTFYLPTGQPKPDLMSTPLSLQKVVNRKGFLMIPHLSQNALNNRVLMIFFPGNPTRSGRGESSSNNYLSNGIILVPPQGSRIVFFSVFSKSFCCPTTKLWGGPPTQPERQDCEIFMGGTQCIEAYDGFILFCMILPLCFLKLELKDLLFMTLEHSDSVPEPALLHLDAWQWK